MDGFDGAAPDMLSIEPEPEPDAIGCPLFMKPMSLVSNGMLGHPGFCIEKLDIVVDGGGEGIRVVRSSWGVGFPSMAESIEYSRFAAVEPNVYTELAARLKNGSSRGSCWMGSVEGAMFRLIADADADVGAGAGAGSGEVGVVADDDGVVAAAAAEYTLPEEKQQWEQAYAASDLWEAMGEEDGKDLRC